MPERKEIKGGLGYISVIFAFAIVIFMIVVVGSQAEEIELSGELIAEEQQNIRQFRSYMTTAALTSNPELMGKIRKYPYTGRKGDEIKNTVHDLLNENKAYLFKIQRRDSSGFNDVLKNSSARDDTKRYSSVYIASPSEKTHKILVAIGEQK